MVLEKNKKNYIGDVDFTQKREYSNIDKSLLKIDKNNVLDLYLILSDIIEYNDFKFRIKYINI